MNGSGTDRQGLKRRQLIAEMKEMETKRRRLNDEACEAKTMPCGERELTIGALQPKRLLPFQVRRAYIADDDDLRSGRDHRWRTTNAG